MASRPDQPPESIAIGEFTGIKNTVSPERLLPGELELAVNIDIDDVGQVRRRRGYALKLPGVVHSLWNTAAGRVLGVVDNELGIVNPDYSFQAIAPASPNPVGFCEVGDTIFYSSADVSGKILSDDTRVDWGSRDGSNRWLSPVVRPTDTLGAISGKLLGAPPQASIIDGWNGRIYMVDGKVAWATELFMFDYVDKTKNYLQFEAEITVWMSVDDGIYVGTEDGLYYLTGQFGQGMVRKRIAATPVVRGSGIRVPATLTKAGADRGNIEALAVMLMTEGGIMTCLPGGVVVNQTNGRTVFPSADSAAALHRDDSGVSSYVAVTRSGGGPTTNARIGDFVDAEIRRSQGS